MSLTRGVADERGAILPMFAISLLVMMGLAAFAVDLGMLFTERRENQAAVDVGALGGGLNFVDGISVAGEEAAEIVRTNLSTSYSDAAWSALWAGCSDPEALTFTGTVLGTPTDCLSMDVFGHFRVVVPDQEIETAFASAMGINSMKSSAFAEVEVSVPGVGGILPFAVLGSASTGTSICLRSSASGSATPPCTGSDAGNFGALEVGQWGNPSLDTDGLGCNLNKSDELGINIAIGVDHFIRPWAGADVFDDCSAQPFGPNKLNTFQGISGGLIDGMITGLTVQSRTFDGRLTQGGGTNVNFTRQSNVYALDDTPLWEFIDYGKAGWVPAVCERESFDLTVLNSGHAAAEAQIETCLTAYAAGPSGFWPLFDIDANSDGAFDITTSARYGIVPQFIESAFPSGTGWLTIGGFRAVFISGMHFKCNGVSCDLVHTPGSMAGPIAIPNGASPLDQVTAFLLPTIALPDELIEHGINGELGLFEMNLSR
jgi:hypothetical protein